MTDSSQCTPCSSSTSESVNFPFSLFQNFGACRFIVSSSVVNIIKLVGPDAIISFFCKIPCLKVVILTVAKGNSGDRSDIGSQHFQQINFFFGLSVWHENHTLISFSSTNMG
eukprot:Lithocolla_globosa_v1_NODE_5875_length_1171_cov_12.820789.p2 type:complete len:112 gc:universal NODE_5875_length_1171_cov_12.820789:551-886(+)